MNERESDCTLLLIGSGVLAGNVLDLLSWSGFTGHTVVAGRNRRTVLERTNLSRISAYNQQRYPRISIENLDLNDVDRSAETIGAINPDIIFNTASVQTYWRISTLPKPAYQTLAKPGLGAWLPMHLSPALRLMTAIRQADLNPIVVNAAYPDAVNPTLATLGLAPTLGIGNVMNVVPAVRTAAALVLAAPVQTVQIRLIAHHYISNRLPEAGDSGGAPLHLSIYHDGREVTGQLDPARVFGLLPTEIRRTRGSAGMYVTASSAFAVLTALLSETPVALHAPGPLGLVGGYPVLVSHRGVHLDLPGSCPINTAAAINKQGQVYDGIRRIDPDGRVVPTELAVETLQRELGYYCPEFRVEDCHDWATELRTKYLAFEAAVTGSVRA
jgi:hypothetical protein